MSCGDSQPRGCNPCSEGLTTFESLASTLGNLVDELFGEFTKTIVNGRAVWTAVCDPNEAGLPCFPRQDGEGFVCYIIRILDQIGTFWEGTWDSGSSYCKNSLVRYGGIVYIALSANVNKQPDLFPLIWELYTQDGATGAQGVPGPQGDPGASGGGSATTYAFRVTASGVTITDTDAVVICTNAGPITITVPDISTLTAGKWFEIHQQGAGQVTIVSGASDTFNGASSFVLNSQYSSVGLRSYSTTNWAIL